VLYVNPLEARCGAPLGPLAGRDVKAKVALGEFEHYFLFALLQEMRKTIPVANETGQSQEEQLYYELFDDAISGEMARSGQFGIARQIEQQLATSTQQPRESRTPDGMPIT